MLGDGCTAPWVAVAPESVTDVAGSDATVVPAKAKKQNKVVPTNSPRKAIASISPSQHSESRSASCTFLETDADAEKAVDARDLRRRAA